MNRFLWPVLAIAFSCATSASAQSGHDAAAADINRPVAGKGWWAFEPAKDDFSPDALLDLRYLNETVAGETGFVRLDPKGESFVRGDGEPIRFWGGTVDASDNHGDMDEHARFLAKRGVNMARWHGNLPAINRPDSLLSDVNEVALDNLFYYVAAMKKQGIYVTLSPYFALLNRVVDDNGKPKYPNWKAPLDSENETTMGLLFFEPEVQAAYKNWIRQMLTRRNPYTGMALKDDPAFAIFQIQNEDSLLFWTLNGVKGKDRDVLERRFGDWLVERYGSLAAAQMAWDHAEANYAPSKDRPAEGIIALPNLDELRKPRDESAGLARRYRDSAQFLTELMRNFNSEIIRFVRDDLHAPQMINAGNWKTADTTHLNDLERYSYDVSDIIAVNRYVGGIHEGSATASWSVRKGERFTSISTIKDINQFPLNVKQVAGHPMMITESEWVPPNAYESEGPFLVSAMQALGGVDVFYWFSLGDITQWYQPRTADGVEGSSVGKYSASSPLTLGQFPAAALSYRLGYVKESHRPAVYEHRSLADLWERRAPLIGEESGFDPNRDLAENSGSLASMSTLSPLSYLVGPVRVDYASNLPDQVLNLNDYIDAKAHLVTSQTGEVKWDYGQGLVRLDTARVQGVAGFLKASGGTFRLADTTIKSANDYAVIQVVSLDGLPIATSQKLLIQVGTKERPSGWIDRPLTWRSNDEVIEGREIVEHGQAPWLIADTDASIEIRNSRLRRAIALDANGLPVRDLTAVFKKGEIQLTLPAHVLYVLVK